MIFTAPLNKTPKEITPELVKNLWKYMSNMYGSKIISKKDSSFMNVIGWALGVMGIQDKDKFMSRYTTTIGNTIYVPFEIGVEGEFHSLYSQIVICVHEHQHIQQSKVMGSMNYNVSYLLNKDERTRLEAEAYRSSLELSWYYFKNIPNTRMVAETLLNYGLNNSHVNTCQAALDSASRSVKAGLVLNQATRVGLSVL